MYGSVSLNLSYVSDYGTAHFSTAVKCRPVGILILFSYVIKVSNPCRGPEGSRSFEATRFRDNKHMKVVKEIFLVFILLEVESTPGP